MTDQDALQLLTAAYVAAGEAYILANEAAVKASRERVEAEAVLLALHERYVSAAQAFDASAYVATQNADL